MKLKIVFIVVYYNFTLSGIVLIIYSIYFIIIYLYLIIKNG